MFICLIADQECNVYFPLTVLFLSVGVHAYCTPQFVGCILQRQSFMDVIFIIQVFVSCYVFHAEFSPNAELTLKEEPLFSDGIKYASPFYLII